MTTVSSTAAKQANTIVPCPPVHASPPATAKQVKFSFPGDSEPLVDDKDVPVVPKKTSGIPQDATKLNPSRKKRANGFYYFRVYNYCSVVSLTVVLYDWGESYNAYEKNLDVPTTPALTFGQEFELIWRQRWSLMTVLYLIVRYAGIPFVVIQSLPVVLLRLVSAQLGLAYVWIAVKHFRELPTGWAVGDCFTVLIETHVFYFASFVAVSCFQLSFFSPKLLSSTSTGTEIFSRFFSISEVVQMFVLGPRLILGVREYHAKLVTDSDEATGMASIVFQDRIHIETGGSV
ncbi:hypothetical protein M405DRAFT_859994 [Rhizopogon salebrosus TDB-379]|nr:hypothetical protein M405DRAFT_859994 [Rhizopogon salebrosus TDB-379]